MHPHHLAHAGQAHLLHRQLRHLPEDCPRRRDRAAEEVREGAGRHQAPEGVHRVVRHLRQRAQAGGVQAEDHRQDGCRGTHAASRQGENVHLQLSGLRQGSPARPSLRQRVLRLQREEGELSVPRSGFRRRLRLPHRARRSQRRWQVHPAQAHDWRAHPDEGQRGPPPLARHRQVPPALRRRARQGEDGAAVLHGPVPKHHDLQEGPRRVARVPRAVRRLRQDADHAHRRAVRGSAVPPGVRHDLHG
mmetsp:Transcript_13762/g.55683  ORF Transcript_13762/g.55683 Transcript_13762/m.55683 type:complete len:247 (-) Transcript_13762:974-1714(-)